MINYRYQLVSSKVFRKNMFNEDIENKIIVKPTYLSICAADLRYYYGKRDPNILKKKLPMSLIHEAIGIVEKGNSNFKKGQKVILYPNLTSDHNKIENYNPESKFMSSTHDGFMQEFIVIDDHQLIKIEDDNDITYVLTELLSVAIHSINSLSNISDKKTIGIWGDGSLSYLIHLYLIKTFPKIKIIIYGKYNNKLEIFNPLCKTVNIEEKTSIEKIDIGIDAVGGFASENIIKEIIKNINPCGTILLLGVSENNISINTRMILEKGITLIGRSRSSKDDFNIAKEFISKNTIDCKKIISSVVDIKSIEDIYKAFNNSINFDFKTIMKWFL